MREVPYIAQGAGPPALLIHGLGGFKEAWGAVPSALEDAGMRALAVDLPGSGAARRPRGYPGTSAAHARTLAALLDQTGPVALVAHSLGCAVALHLAARRPALVTSLTLIAPVVVPRPVRILPRRPIDLLGLPLVSDTLGSLAIAWARRDADRRRAAFPGAVGEPARLVAGGPEDRLLGEAADRLGRADVRALSRWASSALREGAMDALADTRVPLLVITGQRDRLVPPGDVARIAAARPGVRVMALAGVGHFPHLEAPDLVPAAIAAHARPRGGASSRA